MINIYENYTTYIEHGTIKRTLSEEKDRDFVQSEIYSCQDSGPGLILQYLINRFFLSID